MFINQVFQEKTASQNYLNNDIFGLLILVQVVIGSILMLLSPKYSTITLVICRLLICLVICYFNYFNFHDKEICNQTMKE